MHANSFFSFWNISIIDSHTGTLNNVKYGEGLLAAYKANDDLERTKAALFIFGGIACIAPNLKSYDNIRTCARVVKVHT